MEKYDNYNDDNELIDEIDLSENENDTYEDDLDYRRF